MARTFVNARLHRVGRPSQCPRHYLCNGQFIRQIPFNLQVLPSFAWRTRRHGMAIENSAPDTYRGRKSGTKAIVRAKGGQGPGPFSPLCSSPSTSLTSAPGEGRFSAISDGRSPGKTPSLRGDSRAKDEEDSHERSQKPTKRDFGSSSVFVYFRALLWPFPLCSSRADGGISPSREHNQPIGG